MANTPKWRRAIGNEVPTTLSGSMTDSTLTFTVADATGFSTSGGQVIIDEGVTGKEEAVYIESISGTTFTVATDGRGQSGTSAVAHDSGATVTDILVAEHINDPRTSFLVEHNDDGTHKSATLTTLTTAIINLMYPVGTLYTNFTDGTNPGTLFGVGTWVAAGVGKMLVGLNSGDTDFDTAEETGGAKTVTIAKANLPSYNLNVTDSGHTHNGYGAGAPGGVLSSVYTGSSASPSNQGVQATQSATTGITVSSGGSGTALNVMNPYTVVYMWKRTA